MLFFEKSQPAPDCLAQEKTKARGDYKCGDVLSRLQHDFKNKCYICETKAPTAINVEHFRPHKGDMDRKFDWNNLYLSCAHCNNIKGGGYEEILDPTNPNDNIELRLRCRMKPLPFEQVKIEALDADPQTIMTGELILAVFNGTTNLKSLESSNLREKLLTEIRQFQDYLCAYFATGCSEAEKDYLGRKIETHLSNASAFTSFKRWIIRDNDKLRQEFGQFC